MSDIFEKVNIIQNVLNNSNLENKERLQGKFMLIEDMVTNLFNDVLSKVPRDEFKTILDDALIEKQMCKQLFDYYLILCKSNDRF